MKSSLIKVLIVEDSPSDKELLANIIESDPQIQIIGWARNGQEAIDFIKHQTPDVITMDIIMPKIDGLEATRYIMQTKAIPIIIIASGYRQEDVIKSFKCLETGALFVLEKPRGLYDPHFATLSSSIIATIKMVSEVKLITRLSHTHSSVSSKQLSASKKSLLHSHSFKAVAMGSSLGGPQALSLILSHLPSSFPAPIFIVQHILPGFAKGFVNWLSGSTPLKVKLAEDKEKTLPGYVYVAPDEHHMQISRQHLIELTAEPPEGGIRPSIGHLFRSMANVYQSSGIGIILTGMGKDGIEDLLEMKKQGALTIAQDREGCLMFGMPKEAISIDAASHVVPLDQIAPTLKQLFNI